MDEKHQCTLVLGGPEDSVAIHDLHNWCIRWVVVNPNQLPPSYRPELYHNGRRVTRPWSIRLLADMTADREGGNANTE